MVLSAAAVISKQLAALSARTARRVAEWRTRRYDGEKRGSMCCDGEKRGSVWTAGGEGVPGTQLTMVLGYRVAMVHVPWYLYK